MGCETARGGRQLADEAITMATALQLVGFRHTVATLWPVDDADASAVAQKIYGATGPRHPGTPPEAPSARRLDITMARAVHDAVQQLRAEYPFAPNRWAGVVHLGP
jgi:CHAT domain